MQNCRRLKIEFISSSLLSELPHSHIRKLMLEEHKCIFSVQYFMKESVTLIYKYITYSIYLHI